MLHGALGKFLPLRAVVDTPLVVRALATAVGNRLRRPPGLLPAGGENPGGLLEVS